MAYVVGIGLILLVLVGVPLQYAAGMPQVAEIVGPIHGVMYIVYLAAAVDLAGDGQLATRQLAMIALAGFVPFSRSSSSAGSPHVCGTIWQDRLPVDRVSRRPSAELSSPLGGSQTGTA